MNGRRIRAASIVLIVGVVAGGHTLGVAAPPSAGAVGRLLVRFDGAARATDRAALYAATQATVVRRIPAIGYDEITVPREYAPAALAALRSSPRIAVAEPVRIGRIALSPADACLSSCAGLPSQWHLAMTNAPFAWDAVPGRTYTASEKRALAAPTIAVLDTKIDASHPDWINAGGSSASVADGGQLDLANARDWVPSSRWSGAAAYHGTFVAGLAAASTGNGGDAASLGFAARIMPLTVVDGGGMTDSAMLADAIVYAWQRGARVINLSLGILDHSQAVRDAIALVTTGDATRRPSLVVAAAGNNTGSAPFYPGSYPEVLSVAGTDAEDRPASCSNHNANVSVSAPADRLVGLMPMPTRAGRAPCGTSAAAPQVSALAALLFMQDPSRTPAQVRALIERGAHDLGPAGRDDRYGWGRINAERSLRLGASVTAITASVVAGGRSTVTAAAAAEQPVRRAQLVFGRPDAAPVEMRAADGAFGSAREQLVADVSVPAGTTTGPHPVWIRAFDGTSWGPAGVGVVIVDGRAPTISNLSVATAVRATGQPLTISFVAADDHASTVTYGIEVRSTATGQIVYRAARYGVALGSQSVSWTPPLTLAGGHHTVKVAIADPSSNVAHAEAGGMIT